MRAAARAHDALSSAEGVSPYRAHIPMMISRDRPEHTRLRKLVTREFTRDAMERQRPAVERIARDAVGEMAAQGNCDGVALLASPLPVMVIARVLGVPESDFPAFREWSDKIIKGFAVRRGPAALRDSADVLGSAIKFYAYTQEQFQRLRREPGDDVLSGLIASSDEGNLTEDELYWFALMLLLAGNETTTSLLGTMLLAFAERPDQYARVREDPELVPSAVEEALRHGSPIQSLYRTAVARYPVGDATIPAGGRVLLLFAAANRDPRNYAEPGRLRRDSQPHRPPRLRKRHPLLPRRPPGSNRRPGGAARADPPGRADRAGRRAALERQRLGARPDPPAPATYAGLSRRATSVRTFTT